jgi:hypothetical protein
VVKGWHHMQGGTRERDNLSMSKRLYNSQENDQNPIEGT